VAAEIPTWIEEGNLIENAGELEGVPPDQAETLVREGAELFAELGCLQCHTYSGTGSSNLGAPDLTEIGAGDQGVDYFQRYVANPAAFGNDVMPPYQSQGEENLQRVAVFLAASRG
jgi:mono/diheme cytochrome c family protein